MSFWMKLPNMPRPQGRFWQFTQSFNYYFMPFLSFRRYMCGSNLYSGLVFSCF
ncbi:hypothetical protein HanIR_Chr12g0596711 [Helianthus annuus]|nr:hypothetical protein HanIR_Chr12g0596711 [Helianthus annuus]